MVTRPLLLAFALVGCGTVVGEDFGAYVARPTTCDLLAPQTTDPGQHLRCGNEQSCVPATPDGQSSKSATTCFPSGGAKELEPCAHVNDCAPGLFCSPSGCLRWCHVTDNTCAGGATCFAFGPNNGVDDPDLGYCAAPSCDPVGSSCQGTCSFDRSDYAGCYSFSGTKIRGEACSSDGDCARGLSCGSEHVCTTYCRIDQNDCGGRACVPTPGENLHLKGVAYGYCATH
jgi:hypothetical protein